MVEGGKGGLPWYVLGSEGLRGPFSAAQLKALAAEGRLAPEDRVGRAPDGPWSPASSIRNLAFRRTAPHDVFVSYSHKDKAAVDGIIHCLESRGLRCWVAPRDILPGANWGEAIIRAIEACRVLVLVLSKHSNASQQILQEVERAVTKGLIVVPFRIEDVAVSSKLELYVGARHWLDAFTGSLEKHASELADVLQRILESGAPPRPRAPAPRVPAARRSPVAAWGVAAFVLAAGGSFVGWQVLTSGRAQGADAPLAREAQVLPSPALPESVERAALATADPPGSDASSVAPPEPERPAAAPPEERAEPVPRDAAFLATLADAEARLADVAGIAEARTAWSAAADAFDEARGVPGTKERFDAFTRDAWRAAAATFDPTLRGAELAAELDELDAWAELAGCARIADAYGEVLDAALRELARRLEAAHGDVASALEVACDAALVVDRTACPRRGAPAAELVAGCAAAVGAAAPADATPEAALRWLVALDETCARVAGGSVREALVALAAEPLAAVEGALAAGDSLHASLAAYRALAGLPAERTFGPLADGVRAACAPLEQRIREQALSADGAKALDGNRKRVAEVARALPGASLLDGDVEGRVAEWVRGLEQELTERIDDSTGEGLRSVQQALDVRDWKRAESLARDVIKQTPPQSRAHLEAKVLHGLALLGEGKTLDMGPATTLFKEVVTATEGDASLVDVRGRAACGVVRACTRMAEKELADAKLAIGRNDGKALLNDESSYAKAVSSAEHALSLAKAANSPSVAEVEGELAKVVNAWNRSVVPSLRKYRGK